MGISEYFSSNERYIVYREVVWGYTGNENDNAAANGLIYPLRTSGLPRSFSDLPSDGSGLERLY